MRRLKILIWHVHGSYLYYLTQAPHEFYLPSQPDRKGDYIGRFGHIPWGPNVHDVPKEEVRNLDLDCVIFQLPHQFLEDQYQILSPEQQRLPKIYLQHDPPYPDPTDTRHWVNDPNILVVQVTPYNDLMWNAGRSPTRVIEHGVIVPSGVRYTGELGRGIVVINHLRRRGRRLGSDIFENLSKDIPMDLIGMGAEESPGGLKEILHRDLCAFESHYRFFFNPTRYTSFPLALCEAMMIGMPIVALATTEIVTAIENDVSGYVDTRVEVLKERMKELLADPGKAKRLGDGAREHAMERFHIERFIRDWNAALRFATGLGQQVNQQMEAVLEGGES
jgi:hypothetical protein